MDTVNPVLAQKLGLTAQPPEPVQDDTPVTPMRLMRRALSRAADKAVGMSASVLGIAEEDLDAEALIESGPEGWVVLGLRDGSNAGLKGLFLIDPPLRSALIEMQTMGKMLPPAAEQRKVTETDATMSGPFAERLLRELSDVGFGGAEVSPGSYDMGPIADLRTAGLVMVQGLYRCWRITIQIGGSEAQGEMLIAMQPSLNAAPIEQNQTVAWGDALRFAVEDAPAEVDAVLCKMPMSIHSIEQFDVGQVLYLAGTTVGSVTLIGADGEEVTTARLGQLAGRRALRLEVPNVEMEDSPPTPLSAPRMEPAMNLPHDGGMGKTGEGLSEMAMDAAREPDAGMALKTAVVNDESLPMDDSEIGFQADPVEIESS